MGLSFSSTSSQPETPYSAAFDEFVKNVKMSSKILSENDIASIQAALDKRNISKAFSAINDALKDIENSPLSIAVTGDSGAGKSSFINTLRRVGSEEPGAAEVGPVETTMERKKYQTHNYLQQVKFDEYDFFIIISATRFTVNDVNLAKAIEDMKKNFYFVRTKIDIDIQKEEKCKPHTFDKQKILKKIRDNCQNSLLEAKVKEPKVFLVSNMNVSDYDFEKLETTLLSELPAHKRYIFMLTLPNVTEVVIDKKREMLQQKVWLEALKEGLKTALPFNGLFSNSELKMMEKILIHYRSYFGLSDACLNDMAKDLHVSVEQLKACIKSPHLLSVQNSNESLQAKLLKYIEKFVLGGGGLIPTAFYFTKAFYWKTYFLDIVANDAKVLLKKEELFKKKVDTVQL